jgi:hypothetical protein
MKGRVNDPNLKAITARTLIGSQLNLLPISWVGPKWSCQVGGEHIVSCIGVRASEEWLGWGDGKYPDIEAVQKHTMTLYALNWFKYFDSKTYLGSEMP